MYVNLYEKQYRIVAYILWHNPFLAHNLNYINPLTSPYNIPSYTGQPVDGFLRPRLRRGLRAREPVRHCARCACCQPDQRHAPEPYHRTRHTRLVGHF